jgi:hypothetical protein
VSDEEIALTVSKAAEAASEQTADKIEEAIEQNEDPRVAGALEEASVHADTAVQRVGWLRRWVAKLKA